MVPSFIASGFGASSERSPSRENCRQINFLLRAASSRIVNGEELNQTHEAFPVTASPFLRRRLLSNCRLDSD